MILKYNPKNKSYARRNRHQDTMTEAEGRIWNLVLRKDKTGYRFLRQKPIGNYIVDFYCHKLKLGIEIDGDSHDWQGEYDEERTKYLSKLGVILVRYTNHQIYYELDGVILDLQGKMKERKEVLEI